MDAKPTVLVVEDEAILAFNMELALEDAGFAVVTALDGDSAIRKLEADPQKFSVVVTDIKMPGQSNGWDVARRARELLPEIPVLYVSGDSAVTWRENGVSGSKMLTKPFSMAQAISFVDRHTRSE